MLRIKSLKIYSNSKIITAVEVAGAGEIKAEKLRGKQVVT
jgi:hypothetical protein